MVFLLPTVTTYPVLVSRFWKTEFLVWKMCVHQSCCCINIKLDNIEAAQQRLLGQTDQKDDMRPYLHFISFSDDLMLYGVMIHHNSQSIAKSEGRSCRF